MPPARPFRFGVTAQPVETAEEWRALARRIEDLGYSTLFLPDHLGRQLAPVPALAVAAEATTRLRIGTLVAANDFRHPVLHAKEVATLDVLSGGRVEWGVGAGWLVSEYEAAGISFEAPNVRVSRLEESVAVMRALLGPDDVHHEGDHYRINRLDGHPKPIQQPGPPLLVGGAKRRILSFAAESADIIGIAPTPTSGSSGDTTRLTVVDAMNRQLEWIRAAAGGRFETLELNVVAFPTQVTGDRGERAQRIGSRVGLPPDQVLASPHMLVGTAEQLCEELEAHRDRWNVSYWVVPARSANAFAPVVARLSGT